jgi:hypothetical protein
MAKARTKWHRLLGLVLKPLFEQLGFETLTEVDLAMKEQRIDLVVIKKKSNKIDFSRLPKVYWEAFEDLNDYNLISFKTYSESFSQRSLEELYGHLTNYYKINGLKRSKINLYAIVHHIIQKKS